MNEGVTAIDERLDHAPCGYLSLADDGTILAANRTLGDWLGYSVGELCGQHVNLMLPVASQVFCQMYFFPMIRLEGQVEELYVAVQSKGGQTVPMLVNAVRRERQGQPENECVFVKMHRRNEYEQAILLAKREAEEAYRAKDEANLQLELLRCTLEAKHQELLEVNRHLELQATTDALTGLNNRRTFVDVLGQSISGCHHSASASVSLLLIDVDHFKQINDTFGHLTGDSVLQRVASILKAHCRDGDVVARYGGEEFSVILRNADGNCALIAAERLRRTIAEAPWEGRPVTVSIGVATLDSGDDAYALLTKADRALYRSKANGRNRVTQAASLEQE